MNAEKNNERNYFNRRRNSCGHFENYFEQDFFLVKEQQTERSNFKNFPSFRVFKHIASLICARPMTFVRDSLVARLHKSLFVIDGG